MEINILIYICYVISSLWVLYQTKQTKKQVGKEWCSWLVSKVLVFKLSSFLPCSQRSVSPIGCLQISGPPLAHHCTQGDVPPSRNSIQSSVLLQNIIYYYFIIDLLLLLNIRCVLELQFLPSQSFSRYFLLASFKKKEMCSVACITVT